MRSLGIDLTGSEKRASGVALLLDYYVGYTGRILNDSTLLHIASQYAPDVISIDCPLTEPDIPGKIYRECELTLKRRGIGVYWCFLPSMKALTLRGIQLAAQLRAAGHVVIESYPGAAQDLLGVPRKGKGLDALRAGLKSFGIVGDLEVSHDELDAITAALVGLFYLRGEYEALGTLILPRTKERRVNNARK